MNKQKKNKIELKREYDDYYPEVLWYTLEINGEEYEVKLYFDPDDLILSNPELTLYKDSIELNDPELEKEVLHFLQTYKG